MKKFTIAVALGTVLVLAGCADGDTDTSVISDDEAALLDARERPQLPAIVKEPKLSDEEMESLEHRNYPKLPAIGE